MIRIFTGEDRGKIGEEVKRELGKEYEVVEGEGIKTGDLENIFFGLSLFTGEGRKVLIRDLGENKEAFSEFAERVEEFLTTEAKVILLETKVDKRTAAVKKVVKAGVEVKEFKAKEAGDGRAVFGIFDLALRDGAVAVREVEKIEKEQDAFMFFGLLVTQALKRLEMRPRGERERKMMKELQEVDIKMKSTMLEPWTIVKVLLLEMSSL